MIDPQLSAQPNPAFKELPMATATITTAEAMRRAVSELAPDVKNDELASYVKKTFGIEVNMKYISQLKSAAKASLAKGKKGRKKAAKVASTNGTPAPVEAPAASEPTKKVTQAEAMRRAVTELPNAKNDELASYVKTTFGIELDPKYISQLKSAAKASLGKGKKGRKKAAKVASTNGYGPPPADSPPATPPGITRHLRHNLYDILTDMEVIGQIAGRIGGDGVRRLLTLLGK
jgi:hypothetical protein